jgi:hypothetical protein
MDISSLKELGIAGIAIGSLSYICYKLIKELAESRRNYTSFVQDNNHTTTELVREATATMVEVRNAIQTHNEILKSYLNKM